MEESHVVQLFVQISSHYITLHVQTNSLKPHFKTLSCVLLPPPPSSPLSVSWLYKQNRELTHYPIRPQHQPTMVNLKAGTRPPWVGLGAAVWVQIASGNAYNFPLYSHSLKSVLGFNQHQLTMLGVANDVGENVGLIPGIACNKFPPWVILLIGALACFFGYGVLWLALTSKVQSLPYWLVSSLSYCLFLMFRKTFCENNWRPFSVSLN